MDSGSTSIDESLVSVKSENDYCLDSECIRVHLRLKGGVPYESIYELNNDNLICRVPDGCQSVRNAKHGNAEIRTYTFSKIFGPDVTQIEIFDSIVKPRILSFINGRNSTLFTYGASGSGKTFTIVGTPEEPGLIPRALEYIFKTLPKMDDKPVIKPSPNGGTMYLDKSMIHLEKMNKYAVLYDPVLDKSSHTRTYRQMQERLRSEPVAEIEDLSDVVVNVWVSFAEIYNESVHDLLVSVPKGKQRPRLALGRFKDRTYIKNLTSINVCDGMEAYHVLQYGLHNLNYAATAVNSHSSRSHCIFTITQVQISKTRDGICLSSFNFCDLAGSERTKKTMNIGDRLKESNNINTSLFVLGRCKEHIRNLQQKKDTLQAPFRESKLTQLFQRALMGFENIELIVNINPSRDMFDETHRALNFAAIAKEIVVEEKPTEPIRKRNRFSNMVERKKDRQERIEEEDAREQELEKLKERVVDLYNEIEHNREEYYKEMEVEKEYVANLYKKYIEKKEREHQEEIEETVERLKEQHRWDIERSREQHRREIERLRGEFQCNASNGDNSVISIHDSSSEELSPQKKNSVDSDQKKEIRELKRQLALLEVELNDKAEMLKKYRQNEIHQDRKIKELRDERDQLKNQLADSQKLVSEAKESYSSLLDEIDYLKEQRRKLLSENIVLEEKYYELSMVSNQNTCTHYDSKDSDDECDATLSSAPLSVTDSLQSASKMRLNEEEKRLF